MGIDTETNAVKIENYPFAHNYHYSVHALNLCLLHAPRHPEIRNMIGVVREITKFSSCSKKQVALQENSIHSFFFYS